MPICYYKVIALPLVLVKEIFSKTICPYRYPNTVKYIFGIGLFVSYAIVAVSVYYNEFEGTIVIPLE